MGVSSALHASARPSTTCANCHMICGFSGLPKLRQLVAASGFAPVQDTLRAASATACIAPILGSSQHQRPFPSSAMAIERLDPLIRISPASAPGPSTVFDCTMESYCSKIQRLEQMLGAANSVFRFSVRSAAALHAMFAGLVRETGALHGSIGRI